MGNGRGGEGGNFWIFKRPPSRGDGWPSRNSKRQCEALTSLVASKAHASSCASMRLLLLPPPAAALLWLLSRPSAADQRMPSTAVTAAAAATWLCDMTARRRGRRKSWRERWGKGEGSEATEWRLRDVEVVGGSKRRA